MPCLKAHGFSPFMAPGSVSNILACRIEIWEHLFYYCFLGTVELFYILFRSLQVLLSGICFSLPLPYVSILGIDQVLAELVRVVFRKIEVLDERVPYLGLLDPFHLLLFVFTGKFAVYLDRLACLGIHLSKLGQAEVLQFLEPLFEKVLLLLAKFIEDLFDVLVLLADFPQFSQ